MLIIQLMAFLFLAHFIARAYGVTNGQSIGLACGMPLA